jgi:hypothetical protein
VAAELTKRIECPALKTVMKGVFRKKPVEKPAIKKGRPETGGGMKWRSKCAMGTLRT